MHGISGILFGTAPFPIVPLHCTLWGLPYPNSGQVIPPISVWPISGSKSIIIETAATEWLTGYVLLIIIIAKDYTTYIKNN